MACTSAQTINGTSPPVATKRLHTCGSHGGQEKRLNFLSDPHPSPSVGREKGPGRPKNIGYHDCKTVSIGLDACNNRSNDPPIGTNIGQATNGGMPGPVYLEDMTRRAVTFSTQLTDANETPKKTHMHCTGARIQDHSR
ncbi:hypothetical protein Trydic_g4763 [Trypoxylus dichotomus]